MNNENFNPDDCLARLFDVADDLASGVRDDQGKLTSAFRTDEVLIASSNIIVNSIKGTLEEFCHQMNISDKLKNLKELQNKSITNEKSWRPITGEVDIKPLIAYNLKKRKKKLEKEIKKTRDESEELVNYIKKCKQILNKQKEEIISLNLDDVKESHVLPLEISE